MANSIDTALTQSCADQINQAWRSRQPIAPIRDHFTVGDTAAAYAVQEVNTQRWLAEGRRLVGRKIGLTSKAVQKQLGVDQPDYGMLFDDMEVPDGWEVSPSQMIQPKAEAEIAFVVGRDLDNPQLSLAEVIRAVEYALPAIEIVDSRIEGWKIGIIDTIADNASSGLYVLGGAPKLIKDLDLRLCGMVMECRGEPVSTGVGAACLGNPLNAMWWLARTMARAGRPLKAGDTVLSGALGPMVPVAWGDVMEARIAGLGSVRAAFSKE
jgi:2-keto-4-pentenoate hydratase